MKKVLLNQMFSGYKPGRIILLEESEANDVVSRGIGELVEDDQNQDEVTQNEPPKRRKKDE